MSLNDTTALTAINVAVNLVTPFEGFSATPYQDSVGVWTIGFGSTRDLDGNPVTASTPTVTDAQARQLVARDLQAAAEAVARDVSVPLTVNMAAALEDFAYNLGTGALGSSALLHYINQGMFAEAAAEFDKWDHAGGKELAGLYRRREAERKLFVS